MELVKFRALEGSSLTLLGLVKYNFKEERFEMTELSSVMAGGYQEVRKCLEERIGILNF